MTALISRLATAAGVLALASACTMKNQDAPPLTGPSEFSQSITITVSPDVLPQDGASQSFITVTARDANAQPIRNLTMRTETRVGGTPVDFGMLSARSVVTGSDGKATLVYTAPPSPAVSPGRLHRWSTSSSPRSEPTSATPSSRSAAIRLVPQGPVIPPFDLVPVVHASRRNARSTIRPCSSMPRPSQGSIVEYQWDFGDGGRGVGRTASARLRHSRDLCRPPDDRRQHAGGSARYRSRSPYGISAAPDAVFVFSPALRGRPESSTSTPRSRGHAPERTHRQLHVGLRRRQLRVTDDQAIPCASYPRCSTTRRQRTSTSRSSSTRYTGKTSAHVRAGHVPSSLRSEPGHVRNTSPRRTEAPGPAGPGVDLVRGPRRGVPPARHVPRGDRDLPGGTAAASLRTCPRGSPSAARLSKSASTTRPRPSSSRCCRARPENLAAIRALADIHRRRGEVSDADHYNKSFTRCLKTYV